MLTGVEAERALLVVRQVAVDIEAARPRASESLYGGRAGMALFFGYLDRAFPGEGHGERACQLVLEALELAGEEPAAGLAWGVAGLAWAVDHLQGLGLELEIDDSIDELLGEILGVRPWPYPYDLIEGLVGIGLSALGRLERAPARRVADAVLAHLEALAEPTPTGLAFAYAPPNASGPRDYFLGVAHGVAGVAGLMARYVAAGVATARARRLLDGVVATLLAERRLEAGARRFPSRLEPVGASSTPVASSWCHGDVGITVVLVHAARLVGEPAWEDAALEAAEQVASDPLGRVWCSEPGLCHGAAGAAHALNRLHQATSRPAFGVAARRLYLHGLDRFDASLRQADVWDASERLLDGRTGLGLALLAATTSTAPAWDECLMLRV